MKNISVNLNSELYRKSSSEQNNYEVTNFEYSPSTGENCDVGIWLNLRPSTRAHNPCENAKIVPYEKSIHIMPVCGSYPLLKDRIAVWRCKTGRLCLLCITINCLVTMLPPLYFPSDYVRLLLFISNFKNAQYCSTYR